MGGKVLTANEIYSQWIKEKNVHALSIYHFKLQEEEFLTPGQINMIQRIVFYGDKRLLIAALTRWGKSHAAGIAIGLYILLNRNKKINLIGPTIEQTGIIRRIFNKYAQRSHHLMKLMSSEDKADMTTERSKKRINFRNGCILTTIGVNGEGKSAMGEGGDLNVVDEMGLIKPETYKEKVQRMLGDDPENSQMIGLFNPWPGDNVARELWHTKGWEHIQIGWQQGIAEGRTTKEYVDEQRDLLDEVSFMVLYDAKFPNISDDCLLTAEQITESFERDLPIVGTTIDIGCDVARFGSDQTTISVRRHLDCFHMEEHSKEDTMQTTGRIKLLIDFYIGKGLKVIASIDDDGLGGGVTDRLNELYMQNPRVTINPISNGGKAEEEDKYFNRVAELWLWLKKNIEEIRLPTDSRLIKELSTRKYSYMSDGRIQLESKKAYKKRTGKSPDMADSVAYCFASESSDIFFDPIMPHFT